MISRTLSIIAAALVAACTPTAFIGPVRPQPQIVTSLPPTECYEVENNWTCQYPVSFQGDLNIGPVDHCYITGLVQEEDLQMTLTCITDRSWRERPTCPDPQDAAIDLAYEFMSLHGHGLDEMRQPWEDKIRTHLEEVCGADTMTFSTTLTAQLRRLDAISPGVSAPYQLRSD